MDGRGIDRKVDRMGKVRGRTVNGRGRERKNGG